MVYVDRMKAKVGRLVMSHMLADSTEELMAMADQIGVDRSWIQHAGTPKEHFDVCQSKKRLALQAGAKEVGRREIANLIRARRSA